MGLQRLLLSVRHRKDILSSELVATISRGRSVQAELLFCGGYTVLVLFNIERA